MNGQSAEGGAATSSCQKKSSGAASERHFSGHGCRTMKLEASMGRLPGGAYPAIGLGAAPRRGEPRGSRTTSSRLQCPRVARTADLGRLAARLKDRVPTPIEHGVEKRAAVAAILRPAQEELEVLLIRRAEREGDRWSGHMAFPGGQHDLEDRDLLATARRETQEEVGIDLGRHAELLGRLDDLQAGSWRRPTGMIVSPFVFLLARDQPLITSDEVAEALWAPLGPLYAGEARAIYEYPWEGSTLQLPAFRVGPHLVWGLTYRMLEAIFEELRSSP